MCYFYVPHSSLITLCSTKARLSNFIKYMKFIKVLGYKPEDGRNDIYYKQYSVHNNYTLKVNFETEKSEYRSAEILEEMVLRGAMLQ